MTAKTRMSVCGAIVALLIAIVLGWWFFGRQESSMPPDGGVAFSETGNLVYNNPGYREDTWFLVYEKSGAPALSVELAFTSSSVCALLVGERTCPDALTVGMRARVAGVLRDEVVTVTSLTEIAETRDVVLYYYNMQKDLDGKGSVGCSRKGLDAVARTVPNTENALRATLELLLAGQLTQAERERGISTEFPLNGVRLMDVALENGVLTLTFDDPNFATGGGACRVGVLWFQIEATALQFPEVTSVRFMPEELFQP